MAKLVPTSWRDATDHFRLMANAINSVIDGRQNNVGTLTLTANAGTTVVSDRRAGTESVISLMPTTGNAAAEIGAGTLYIASVTAGAFTVTHANNAQTDRTFKYEVTG